MRPVIHLPIAEILGNLGYCEWNLRQIGDDLFDQELMDEEDAYALPLDALKEVEEVAKLIGIPHKEWAGHCMVIANACVQKGIVQGRVVYGCWLGETHANSRFAKRLFCHHSWVEMENGKIFDPTQWCFGAMRYPYLYLGERLAEYDLAGVKVRQMASNGLPEPDGRPITFDSLSHEQIEFITRLSPIAQADGDKVTMPLTHALYICNTNLFLMPDPASFMESVDRVGNGASAWIPIDIRDEIKHLSSIVV